MRVPLRRISTLLMAWAMVSLMATAAPVAAQPSPGKLLRAIREARTYARTLPEAFGGAWLTDGDDGAVFAFTHRATDEQTADVLGRVESWVPISIVRVDHSEAEITAAKEAISLAARTDELPFVNGIGTDPKNNAVVVSIAPEWFDVCQAGIVARFAPMRILFESSAGDRGLDSTPQPAASPSASLPPGCLPPTPSPLPSEVAPSVAPGSPVASALP